MIKKKEERIIRRNRTCRGVKRVTQKSGKSTLTGLTIVRRYTPPSYERAGSQSIRVILAETDEPQALPVVYVISERVCRCVYAAVLVILDWSAGGSWGHVDERVRRTLSTVGCCTAFDLQSLAIESGSLRIFSFLRISDEIGILSRQMFYQNTCYIFVR